MAVHYSHVYGICLLIGLCVRALEAPYFGQFDSPLKPIDVIVDAFCQAPMSEKDIGGCVGIQQPSCNPTIHPWSKVERWSYGLPLL